MPSSNATVSTASSQSTNGTRQKVNERHRKSKTLTPEEKHACQVIPRLAGQAYHLSGYNLQKDWLQYMFNHHPLFGIFCHNRLYPLKMRQRLIMLLGSFAFGVAIPNAIFLWFLETGRDETQQVFVINFSNTTTSKSQSYGSYAMTSGMIALVTVGSGSNALFDRFVWTLLACACCRPGGRFESRSRGRCKDLGKYLAILMVIVVVAMATCIVIVRGSVEEQQSGATLLHNRTTDELASMLSFNDFDVRDYSFMRGYAIEFGFSLFVYYPFIETVLFSGILGCFSLPILGGRPGQMKREAKAQSEAKCACPSQKA